MSFEQCLEHFKGYIVQNKCQFKKDITKAREDLEVCLKPLQHLPSPSLLKYPEILSVYTDSSNTMGLIAVCGKGWILVSKLLSTAKLHKIIVAVLKLNAVYAALHV